MGTRHPDFLLMDPRLVPVQISKHFPIVRNGGFHVNFIKKTFPLFLVNLKPEILTPAYKSLAALETPQ